MPFQELPDNFPARAALLSVSCELALAAAWAAFMSLTAWAACARLAADSAVWAWSEALSAA